MKNLYDDMKKLINNDFINKVEKLLKQNNCVEYKYEISVISWTKDRKDWRNTVITDYKKEI